MNTHSSPTGQAWIYGTVRTILISYGVVAFTMLSGLTATGDEPRFPGVSPLSTGLVTLGLAAQVLLFALRLLIKRRLPDRASATQAMMVVELVGDGLTVLFFALGTLGPILHMADYI